MIRLAWRGLWQRKVRTMLTLVGVTVCVLALTTMGGMSGYLRVEREQDSARFTNRLLLQSPSAGYPPFKNTLRLESVTAALDWPGVIANESTPLLFLVLAPPDNQLDMSGVIGLGLWPGREPAWLGTMQVTSGQATLAGEGNDAVLLGYQAARFYGVSAVGETINLAGRSWRVAGLLAETRVSNLDTLMIMPLASALPSRNCLA